jgi:hypothetical protein
MSAGAVTIEYSLEKSLIIHETPGALWECGEWTGITEEKIYQRLYRAMIGYIENREKQPNLACPLSTIFYPFRLLKESQIQFPEKTRVRILDLPGLAYIGDRGNMDIIKQCRDALCLVTYNSAETDSYKVQSLLQEVVQQVKDLGGSPARMLFVLNRIDVFRADRNWIETENRFCEKTIRSIKDLLTDKLKEYSAEIANLEVVKLSTWPALLSLQVQSNDEISSLEACKKADNHFNGLIADILEDLPRNTQKWSQHDRNRVAQALWEKSYAEEFHRNLVNHITQHFPQLVIPQIIAGFKLSAGNAIAEWATQTTTAILHSSEEDYQSECENISHIQLALERFLEISNTNLREPFERIDTKIKQVLTAESNDDDPVFYLESTIAELKDIEPYNLLGEKLYPLYGWRRELGQGINQVLEAVAKSLESGQIALDSPNLKKANILHINLLERNLNRLVTLDYTASFAQEGKIMEARTEVEKNRLKQINEGLNELSIHLNIVMEDVIKQIFNQELQRMHQAVVELFNCHLSHVETKANEIAPNIEIRFPDSQLSKVESQPVFNFSFQAGFPVIEGSWLEEIQVKREKRTWYTLWIAKKTIYQTQYQRRSSDNARIPSVEDLLTGWILQSKAEELSIVNQIARWLLEQIDYLKKDIDKIQHDVIDRYQARLDKANQEITLDYEKQISIWDPMQKKAQVLAEHFHGLQMSLKERTEDI